MTRSFLFNFGLFILLLVGAFAGYSYYRSAQVGDELALVKSEYSRLEASRSEGANVDFQSTINAIAAKNTLERISADTILWSQVIERVNKVVPKVNRNEPMVDILSYAGSGGNEISLNVSTVPSRENPYADVADMIQAFDESGVFFENFVPSISAGINAEGKEVLTFTFNTNFLKPSLEDVDFYEPVTEEDSSGTQILR